MRGGSVCPRANECKRSNGRAQDGVKAGVTGKCRVGPYASTHHPSSNTRIGPRG